MRKSSLLLLLGWLIVQQGRAQLCQGSLGDPIVNITFGSGSNPGPALSAAATNYQFRTDDCPNDGYYTVRNRTDNCFSGWHSLQSDHTGNANGYFMLVNASYQPGAFYLDTVDLFCSNTTYEFAAWVANMNRPNECSGNPIQPNLTFSIEKTDGTILQTYNSGDISPQSTVTWRQYGFFFNTPANISRIVLRIINNAAGGCGNDLALDDITFRPCGPLVNASMAGNSTTKNFCEGQAGPQTFSGELSPGYENAYLQWQQSVDGAVWSDVPGAHETTLYQDFSSKPPAEYRYRLTVSKIENLNIPACRIASNVVTVRINANPAKTLTSNSPVCQGAGITLSATGGATYVWAGPGGFSSAEPTVQIGNAQPSQSGAYMLVTTNAAGCSRKDTLQVLVNPSPVASVLKDTVFICEGASARLEAGGGSSYIWEPSGGLSSGNTAMPLASPKDSTRYLVRVSNAFSCTDTAYVQVNVSKKPLADAGPDQYIMQGKSAQLNGSVGGTHVTYSWTPLAFIDDPSSLQPVVQPERDITYTLQVTSQDGCGTAADSAKVHVFKSVYVPNAFSPNGDGLNDYWNIPALKAYSDYEIRVFNRWGQLIYQSKNSNAPWNGTFKGKRLPAGVYAYIIDLKEVPATLTGWVMVVR